MRAIIQITIEDDTPEEMLLARGMSRGTLREMYEEAMLKIINAITAEGCRASLIVGVGDNTKEADK